MCAKKLTEKKKTKVEPSKKPRKKAVKPVLGKKKLVVSYKNLAPDLVELIKEKYPKGYSDYLIKVNKGNGEFFYAITLDTDEANYLIKVDVKIDSEIEEVEKALFDQSDVDDDFPDDAPFDDVDDE